MYKVELHTINNDVIEIITDIHDVVLMTRIEHAIDRKEMLMIRDVNDKEYYIAGEKILYSTIEEF